MTVKVDVEEIETTKGEKLLAVVLAAFLLIGLLWIYFNVDVERRHHRGPDGGGHVAVQRHQQASEALWRARQRAAGRRAALTDRREAYRTALDEGRSDRELRRRYEVAQRRYAQAQAERRRAARRERLLRPAADAAVRRDAERVARLERHDKRVSVARRLGLVLGALAAALGAVGRLRRRRSRYMPTAMSAAGAVAALALVMGVDYLEDYVEITDLGVLVLSAAGALMTLVAFAALQRYLARRLPERRVRRNACPFCGYPTAGTAHCEGCGRDVVAPCASCQAPRRVGTRHCGACGAA